MNRGMIILLAMIAVFVPVLLAGEKPAMPKLPADRILFEDAFGKLTSGEFDGALKLFDTFVKEYGNSSIMDNALFHRAKTLDNLKRYKEAVDAYNSMAKKFPKSSWADDALAEAGKVFQFKLKDDKAARECYELLNKKYPKSRQNPMANRNLAQIHQRNGDVRNTRHNLQAANDRARDQGQFSRNSFNKDVLRQQVFLDKNDDLGGKPLKLFSVGQGLAIDEKFAEARAKMKELLKSFPEANLADDAMLKIAEYWEAEGAIVKALQAYEVLQETFPKSEFAAKVKPRMDTLIEKLEKIIKECKGIEEKLKEIKSRR